jgi:predicted acylesterase/phospholipase RssA
MATTRRKGHRLGLALAGGGPAGAVYEIGALRAIEEAVEGLELNKCSVYVGVSAGAFVAATLANGLTLSQLVRGMVTDEPGEHPFDPAIFFLPAYREWVSRGLQLPMLAADALLQFTRRPQDQTLLESLTRLTRALPLAVFDNEPIRRYLQRTFSLHGRSDDFRRLGRKLFVVAADLEAGTPIVFGAKGWDHVPISRAVQASTAVPGLYPPVEIEGRLCVDGVLLKTVHASVALEHGADLLLCVNPLVPVDLAAGEREGKLGKGALHRRGLPAILSQTFRTMIHSRMVVGMARYHAHYPTADVVLFEPARREYRLFFGSIFSFRARREVWEIAYRATRRDLWRRRATLGPIFRRHGYRLRLDLLRDEERTVWEGVGLSPDGRTVPVTGQLSQALAGLEGAVG